MKSTSGQTSLDNLLEDIVNVRQDAPIKIFGGLNNSNCKNIHTEREVDPIYKGIPSCLYRVTYPGVHTSIIMLD